MVTGLAMDAVELPHPTGNWMAVRGHSNKEPEQVERNFCRIRPRFESLSRSEAVIPPSAGTIAALTVILMRIT